MEETIKNEHEYRVVKESVRKLYQANIEKKKFDKYYEALRKKEQLIISNYVYCCLPKEDKSFTLILDEGKDFYENHKKLRVVPVRRRKITWNVSRLKEKINKRVVEQVIKREYHICDMPGLIKYLKACGVNPKEFKKYIEILETVDSARIDELSEVGEISRRDIENCYAVEVSEPYIKITEVENEETV